jgi:probable HAF family extracellular repeat protein
MNSRVLTHAIAVGLFGALILPVQLAGQHPRYKIVDLGTFGGPISGQTYPGRTINNSGTVIAQAELATADPLGPNCLGFGDCLVVHALKWQAGVITELQALPGVNGSFPFGINDAGIIVGVSENSLIDPLTGFPQAQAVRWGPVGGPVALGDLGGHGSQVNYINNRGQVVGTALNATADDFSTTMYVGLPAATQARAFLWQPGAPMKDLLTLGGPDANASMINDRGQVAGFSFTNYVANSTTGIPTIHPFVWEEHTGMVDLGSLGGTIAVAGNFSFVGGLVINNRGQVAGTSYLAGDQTFHPFLWEHGVMKDLQTLGGNNGEAYFIGESGIVVGRADISPLSTVHHAFLWKNGVMIDLKSLPPCLNSTATSVNSSGQVVGDTGRCPDGGGGHPFFSEHGEPMVDLTSLVLPGSDLTLTDAAFINDRGEIAGTGVLPNGDHRAVVLVPASKDEIEAASALPYLAPAPATADGAGMTSSPRPRNRSLNAFPSRRVEP